MGPLNYERPLDEDQERGMIALSSNEGDVVWVPVEEYQRVMLARLGEKAAMAADQQATEREEAEIFHNGPQMLEQ